VAATGAGVRLKPSIEPIPNNGLKNVLEFPQNFCYDAMVSLITMADQKAVFVIEWSD